MSSDSDSVRMLNRFEFALARNVFQRTVPYRAVRVMSRAGLGGLPYTTNNVGFEDEGPTYHLNVGPHLYGGMQQFPAYSKALIHELVHVWQSSHSVWPASFIFASLGCKIAGAVEGEDPYAYTAGQPWSSYNVEQQAAIVADWFDRGQLATSVLFPYIRDQIRGAKAVT